MADIDGGHRLTHKAKRHLSSVIVTPLQPPFPKRTWFLDMGGELNKTLAITREEGLKVKALTDGVMEGQTVMVEGIGNGKVRISLLEADSE